MFASASCKWGLLAELFFFFVAVVLPQVVRGDRHEGTPFPAMRVRPSRCTSTCARDAREMEVRRRLWAKQVHHTAQACPSSEESGTTHQERPNMLTKRHTTPALVGADRKRAGIHRVHPDTTRGHWRQADALGGRNLACSTLPTESLLRCIATCTYLNLSHEEGPLPRRRQ